MRIINFLCGARLNKRRKFKYQYRWMEIEVDYCYVLEAGSKQKYIIRLKQLARPR